MLIQWAEQRGRRGFLVAADLLNAKGDNLSSTAKLLVTKAPNSAEILDQLLGNLQSGSFVGPTSSHLEGHLATLRRWAKDEDPRIRAWAEKAIAYAMKGLKRQKLLEEEQMF
jgi:hypothetical protein